MEFNETLPKGCLVGAENGRDTGLLVQELAMERGWSQRHAVLDVEDYGYEEAWDKAEDYLAGFVPKGCWLGTDPDGLGWGVWDEEEE